MAANEVLYGFAQLKDGFSRPVSDVGEREVIAAVGVTLESHNRDIQNLIGLFGSTTTQYSEMFRSVAAARMQPMDEYGRPRPIKSSQYSVAFPLQMAATADGWTFVTWEKATVAAVHASLVNQLIADTNWVRSIIMAALFTNTNYTYVDPDKGDLTIKPLANGDTQQYFINGSTAATDTHYLAQANAVGDNDNPFPGIYTELTEHAENTGNPIVFVASAQVAAIRNLTNFVELSDSNINVSPLASTLKSGPNVSYLPGRLIGYVDGCYIVEWVNMPSGYMIAITEGGDDALAFRQDPEPTLNGLILLGREDSPYFERHFYRRIGAGVRNRVRALVQRVGNGSYAIPTGYTAPLA